MEIKIYNRYGYNLIVEDTNVKIEEDIEEIIYPKGEDGKTDYKARPTRDIKEEYLDMISVVLDDMVYYRKREYDSSELIGRLFDKLPPQVQSDLSTKLYKEYKEE